MRNEDTERIMQISGTIKQIGSHWVYKLVESLPSPHQAYIDLYIAFVAMDLAMALSRKRVWRIDPNTGETWEVLKLDIEDEGEVV